VLNDISNKPNVKAQGTLDSGKNASLANSNTKTKANPVKVRWGVLPHLVFLSVWIPM